MERRNEILLLALVLSVLVPMADAYVVIEPESAEELLLINISKKLNLTFDETILFLDMMQDNDTQIIVYNVTNVTVLEGVTNYTVPDTYTKAELDSRLNIILNEQKSDMLTVQAQLSNTTDYVQVYDLQQQLLTAEAKLLYTEQLHQMEKEYLEASVMLKKEDMIPQAAVTETQTDADLAELKAENERLQSSLTAKATDGTTDLSSNSIMFIVAVLAVIGYLGKQWMDMKKKIDVSRAVQPSPRMPMNTELKRYDKEILESVDRPHSVNSAFPTAKNREEI